MIGRKKILLILVLNTLIIAGIYIAAVQMRIEFVFHLYWILSVIMICAYMFLVKRNEYLDEKESKDGLTQESKERSLKRKKRLKYFLLVMIPFLFTIIGDTVYLFFLKDLDLFNSIVRVFSM